MAYVIADDLDALRVAVKRKRNRGIGKVRNADGLTCVACGIAITDPYPVNPGEAKTRTDKGPFTVHFDPRAKRFAPMHYLCSWGSLLSDVLKMGRAIA
jgi:hypothetical protein